MGGDGPVDLAFRIQRELLGDLAPQTAKGRGGARADQAGELVGAEREAAVGIHLPHESQWILPRLRRLAGP